MKSVISATNAPSNELILHEPSVHQLALLEVDTNLVVDDSYIATLNNLLQNDLNFHNADTSYATHDFHAFPAKFPPQLPRKFILNLTQPGDIILDPMMGSGTTVVEGILNQRRAIGFDIDPLARLITRVKTTPLNLSFVAELGKQIVAKATHLIENERDNLVTALDVRWDKETKEFIDYWFAEETQIELMALVSEIEKISDAATRAFCELTLSACIVTKSGGVSLAFDLAHTRPHRAKVAYTSSGKQIVNTVDSKTNQNRIQFLTKTVRSALIEFRKRFQQNLKSLIELDFAYEAPKLEQANAQNLPINPNSIDLIITSPPYASNAIDYMRAHKFSLVWLGYSLKQLTETRKECIGGENTGNFYFSDLPPYTARLVRELQDLDAQKGKALHRYYTEMHYILSEMYRVLKPGKSAIVVVASSIMRGKDTETDKCLAEIGEKIGFIVPQAGVRHLDRNKRMLPAGMKINRDSQIQQRMHEEYVIGFYKPAK